MSMVSPRSTWVIDSMPMNSMASGQNLGPTGLMFMAAFMLLMEILFLLWENDKSNIVFCVI